MKLPLLFAATLSAGLSLAAAQEEAPATLTLSGSAPAAPAAEASPAPSATPAAAAEEEEKVPTSIDPAQLQQEAAEEAQPTEAPVPETPRAGVDEPLPLIPEGGLPAIDPGAADVPLPGGKMPILKKGTAEELRQAVRLREARTAAMQDAAVKAEKEKASAAKTYEGRRTALRNYYVLLAARMTQLDATIKEPVERELKDELSRLEQTRVRPTVLTEPIPALPGSRAAKKE